MTANFKINYRIFRARENLCGPDKRWKSEKQIFQCTLVPSCGQGFKWQTTMIFFFLNQICLNTIIAAAASFYLQSLYNYFLNDSYRISLLDLRSLIVTTVYSGNIGKVCSKNRKGLFPQHLCFMVFLFLFYIIVQQQCPPSDLSFNFDANKQQRQLIAELENKNRYSSSIY